ncbi:MAG TPA: hypothetical protein VNW73_12375, partial [Ktedonobacteraceae bacterium]|nr:hypothetical protein [Ktedonobacteraceae bacterium]
MSRFTRHRRLTITGIILAPSLLLLLLITIHIIPLAPKGSMVIFAPSSNPNLGKSPLQLSSDPYTNSNSQHQTELEPASFSFGSTIVTAFQTGRFVDAASSNIGWAISLDNGVTWKNGFLPGTTQFAGGPNTRVSDPSVAYDLAHKTWIISSVAVIGSGSTLASPTIIVNLSTNGGLTWSKPLHVVNGGSTYYDKDWIVCDNSLTIMFYGHCYIEW